MSDELTSRNLSRLNKARVDYDARLLKPKHLPPPSFAVGHNGNTGKLRITTLGQGSTEATPITNGGIARGDRVTAKGGLIDAMPRVKETPEEPVPVKEATIQILFQVENKLYVGGDRPTPIEVFTLPDGATVLTALVHNLGKKRFIVGLRYQLGEQRVTIGIRGKEQYWQLETPESRSPEYRGHDFWSALSPFVILGFQDDSSGVPSGGSTTYDVTPSVTTPVDSGYPLEIIEGSGAARFMSSGSGNTISISNQLSYQFQFPASWINGGEVESRNATAQGNESRSASGVLPPIGETNPASGSNQFRYTQTYPVPVLPEQVKESTFLLEGTATYYGITAGGNFLGSTNTTRIDTYFSPIVAGKNLASTLYRKVTETSSTTNTNVNFDTVSETRLISGDTETLLGGELPTLSAANNLLGSKYTIVQWTNELVREARKLEVEIYNLGTETAKSSKKAKFFPISAEDFPDAQFFNATYHP
jgi:hypothetical protein